MLRLLLISLLLIPALLFAEVDFDGNDDQIIFDTLGDLGDDIEDMTVSFSCWLKCSGSNRDGLFEAGTVNNTYICVKINANDAGGSSSGGVYCCMTDASGNDVRFGINSNTAINDDAWIHLVVIWGFSTNTGKIYFDGVEQSITYDKQDVLGSTSNFGTAASIGDEGINGTLTEMALFDGELTQQDINNLHQSFLKRMPLNCSVDVLMYWPFDDHSGSGDGETFMDMGGGGHDGTGDDGGNNSGLDCWGESFLSYPE